MSDANNFSRIDQDSVSMVNVASRVAKGATTLYTQPSYYVNNTLQWQFRSVPNPIPAQAPNHISRLIDTGVFPSDKMNGAF
jgi:hypothetical protein